MAVETFEEFLLLGVNSLKSYIKKRGVSTRVYLKVELAARTFSTFEMNLAIVMSSTENKNSF